MSDPTRITESDVREEVPEFTLGQLAYAQINEGRGVKLVQLLSRHSATTWDVNLYPGAGFKHAIISNDDLLHYDPYDEDLMDYGPYNDDEDADRGEL